MTVICSNVSLPEPIIKLNPASSSLLNFLPTPLHIPSMELPGIGDLPVCLGGQSGDEASLLCSSQGLACGLPSYPPAQPNPKPGQNSPISPYSVALSCPPSSESLASCALRLSSSCQVTQALLKWKQKLRRNLFKNKLNDESVFLFSGLKINDPDHPQAAAVSCSSSGAALSQCQALKGRQRQGMKVSLV